MYLVRKLQGTDNHSSGRNVEINLQSNWAKCWCREWVCALCRCIYFIHQRVCLCVIVSSHKLWMEFIVCFKWNRTSSALLWLEQRYRRNPGAIFLLNTQTPSPPTAIWRNSFGSENAWMSSAYDAGCTSTTWTAVWITKKSHSREKKTTQSVHIPNKER